MAKIKLSAIGITMLIGKVAGQIFSRNKGGLYVKNFVKPSNPNTSNQQAVRTIFAAVSQLWNTLTTAQRDAWKLAAKNFPITNAVGDTIILTGRSFFQKVNCNLMNNDNTPVLIPPTVDSHGVPVILGVTNAVFTIGAGDIVTVEADVNSSAASDGADHRVIVGASLPYADKDYPLPVHFDHDVCGVANLAAGVNVKFDLEFNSFREYYAANGLTDIPNTLNAQIGKYVTIELTVYNIHSGEKSTVSFVVEIKAAA